MNCEHPISALTLNIGGTGQRGKSSTSQLECSACKARWADPQSVKVLVDTMRSEHDAIWSALCLAGLSRDRKPSPATLVKTKRPDCEHYLSWIRVETTGAGRGSSGVVHFKCAGCKTAWNQPAGLKAFLDRAKKDYDAIHKAMRRLGIELE